MERSVVRIFEAIEAKNGLRCTVTMIVMGFLARLFSMIFQKDWV